MSAYFILIKGTVDGSRETSELLTRLNFEEKLTNEEYDVLNELNYRLWEAKQEVDTPGGH